MEFQLNLKKIEMAKKSKTSVPTVPGTKCVNCDAIITDHVYGDNKYIFGYEDGCHSNVFDCISHLKREINCLKETFRSQAKDIQFSIDKTSTW